VLGKEPRHVAFVGADFEFFGSVSLKAFDLAHKCPAAQLAPVFPESKQDETRYYNYGDAMLF